MGDAIRDASAVFVGNVVEVTNFRRWATVDVVDVWKGDASEQTEVRAGPKDPPGPSRTVTSIDRTYRDGQTYLFVVYSGNGTIFRDNSCSRTTLYRPELERFNPNPASSPRPSASDPTPTADPAAEDAEGDRWPLVIAVIVVLAAGLFAMRVRRSPT